MNTPRRPTSRPLGGEFAETIGDRQQAGDPDIRGVLPRPHNVPPGIAPPSPLQVQSVFDTRPLSAYDFAFDGFGVFGDEAPPFLVEAQVPNGYTAVLRRVQFEFTPPLALAVSPVGSGGPPLFQFFLTRDAGVIPANVVRFRGVCAEYEWQTHQVFGMNSFMGVRGAFAAGGAEPIYPPDDGIDVTVRFFGTLIPSRSLPPSEEVGSDPVMVRDFVKMQRGE